MKAPDVLLVVLDCLRHDADDPAGPVRAQMPVLRSLRDSGTWYPQAIAASHWTLPSHTSVLTGLDPWEHRVFRGSTLALPPDVETYPGRFRRAGYRTACFSANPFVSPLTGLDRDFDLCEWGQFSDCFFRFPAHPRPAGRRSASSDYPLRGESWTDRDISVPIRDSLRRLSTRFPLPLETFAQGFRLLHRASNGTAGPTVSGWIEPEVRRFLERGGPDQPVFVVVNLLEAHEPYFGVLGDERGVPEDWLWAYSGPLDRLGWREGRRAPTPRDAARVTRLYRAAAETLDRRLGSLLSTFGSVRDLARTDLLVVGDHGQALGEGGRIYHVQGGGTATLRVPLVVRPSEGDGRGVRRGWVSIRDGMRLLASSSPPIAAVLGTSNPSTAPHRCDLAVALMDAPPPTTAPRRGSSELRPRDQAIAVFAGEYRTVFDVNSDTVTAGPANVEKSGEPVDARALRGPAIEAYEAGKSALAQLRACLSRGDTLDQEGRLASWGY